MVRCCALQTRTAHALFVYQAAQLQADRRCWQQAGTCGDVAVTSRLGPARVVLRAWRPVMLPVVSGCGSMWYRTICASSCLQRRRHLVNVTCHSQQGS